MFSENKEGFETLIKILSWYNNESMNSCHFADIFNPLAKYL
jgi:hypothetical protein